MLVTVGTPLWFKSPLHRPPLRARWSWLAPFFFRVQATTPGVGTSKAKRLIVAEKIAAGDNSKVSAANFSSLTYKEKRRLREAAAKRNERLKPSRPFSYLNDEEKRMMREDVVWEEVEHECENEENEESETFELNDLFLSD
ncbi:hypothetical protein Tco_0886415 [Tanacetum coccineum]